MELVVQGKHVAERWGTYCAGGDCAEAAGPDGLKVTLSAGRAEVTFEWEWDAEHYEVSLRKKRSYRHCFIGSTIAPDDVWEIALPRGKHMIHVFADWDGGDASYDWFVRGVSER